MSAHNMTPALTADHHEALEFDEDTEMLSILREKLFRRAIDADAKLPTPPDLEPEVIAASIGHEQLTQAIEELDEALSDDSALAREIAKWAEELAAAKAEA